MPWQYFSKSFPKHKTKSDYEKKKKKSDYERSE